MATAPMQSNRGSVPRCVVRSGEVAPKSALCESPLGPAGCRRDACRNPLIPAVAALPSIEKGPTRMPSKTRDRCVAPGYRGTRRGGGSSVGGLAGPARRKTSLTLGHFRHTSSQVSQLIRATSTKFCT